MELHDEAFRILLTGFLGPIAFIEDYTRRLADLLQLHCPCSQLFHEPELGRNVGGKLQPNVRNSPGVVLQLVQSTLVLGQDCLGPQPLILVILLGLLANHAHDVLVAA